MNRLPLPLVLALVLLVGLPLVGGIAGYVWRAAAVESGFLLGTPPKPAVKIDGALTFYVVVQGADNEFFQCDLVAMHAGKNCWSQIAPPVRDENNYAYTQYVRNAAANPTIEASRFAPPPGKIKDFWVSTYQDEIGGHITEARYALLDDGRVWAWIYDTTMFTNVSKDFEQWVGGLGGACCLGVLGLVLWLGLVIVLPRIQPSIPGH